MNREESIEIALKAWSMTSKRTPFRGWFEDHAEWFETFAKLVAAKEREACEKRFMQLFLDPENQPTQFGTATQEYREQEIAEVRDLLFALAHRIRTTHLYGMEVQKMLEQAEAIRARGEA